MIKQLGWLMGCLFPFLLAAQEDSLSVEVQVIFQQQPVHVQEEDTDSTPLDSIQWNTVQFYLYCQLINNASPTNSFLPANYKLINLEEKSSQQFKIGKPSNANQLQITLGIDQKTSEQGVLGGALDPVNGMYWTWQSGYINVKLEGIHPSISTKDKHFSYHLGGYRAPFLAANTKDFSIEPACKKVVLKLDLTPFFELASQLTTYRLMSPGQTAVRLSQTLAASISIHEN